MLPRLQENIMKANIDKKFSAHYDAVEAELKSSTVGEWRSHPLPDLATAARSLLTVHPHSQASSPLMT